MIDDDGRLADAAAVPLTRAIRASHPAGWVKSAENDVVVAFPVLPVRRLHPHELRRRRLRVAHLRDFMLSQAVTDEERAEIMAIAEEAGAADVDASDISVALSILRTV